MVYYLTYLNTIITSDDLKKAFFICTGKSADNNEKDFWKFREECFGKSIKETIKPSIDTFCSLGQRIKAIKLYYREKGCSLKEAKDYIDKYCKDHNYYPYNKTNIFIPGSY